MLLYLTFLNHFVLGIYFRLYHRIGCYSVIQSENIFFFFLSKLSLFVFTDMSDISGHSYIVLRYIYSLLPCGILSVFFFDLVLLPFKNVCIFVLVVCFLFFFFVCFYSRIFLYILRHLFSFWFPQQEPNKFNKKIRL